MAVSLKALCYAIYVSAAIACLGSVPWDLVLAESSFRLLRLIRGIRMLTILPYSLVLVIFYKIRDRLDKKKDGPWMVFFACGLITTILSMVVRNLRGFGLLSMLGTIGTIWMARKKLKEQEASGEDMPYYALVGYGSAPVSQVELGPISH